MSPEEKFAFRRAFSKVFDDIQESVLRTLFDMPRSLLMIFRWVKQGEVKAFCSARMDRRERRERREITNAHFCREISSSICGNSDHAIVAFASWFRDVSAKDYFGGNGSHTKQSERENGWSDACLQTITPLSPIDTEVVAIETFIDRRKNTLTERTRTWRSRCSCFFLCRNLNQIRSTIRDHGNLIDRHTIMARRFVLFKNNDGRIRFLSFGIVLFWAHGNTKASQSHWRIVSTLDWNWSTLTAFFCKCERSYSSRVTARSISFSKDRLERWFKYKMVKVLVYFGYIPAETGAMIQEFQ